LFAAQVKSSR